MNDPRSFGAALRRERERRGVSLVAIAEQTKLSVSLLEGLERGDLSRWPGGIFRRAFVRSYAEVIGLDTAAVVETFVRVCPEGPAATVGDDVAATPSSGPRPLLRLTLAEPPRRALGDIDARRLRAAALDVAAAVVPALLATAIAGTGTGIGVLALVSVVYGVAGTIVLGTSPGSWWVTRQPSIRVLGAPRSEPASAPVPPADDAAADAVTAENSAEVEPDGARRRVAEVFFTPRRRDRRAAGRADRHPRRPDSRAARH